MIVTKTIKGRVLAISNDLILIYRRGFLIVCENSKTNKVLSRKKIGNWIEKSTLLSRLLRREPRCAVKLGDSSFLISYNGHILNYDYKKNIITDEHSYDKGMKNPLSFCVEKTCKDEEIIYYGEYIWNEKKGPVAVYKRSKSTWTKVFEFDCGMITHIHNIVFDEFKKCFYILTGDDDSDSGIWIADYSFSRVEPLIVGKQAFRSCVLFPFETELLYATDTPLEENTLSKIVCNNKVEVETISSLPGSCIYGGKVNGEYYFATTVEPDSSLPGLRYRFTYKLGKGIKDRYSHIFKVKKDGMIEEVYKAKKDILPMWLFQFGNFIFPYNETNSVVVVSQALKCGHSKTLFLGENIDE